MRLKKLIWQFILKMLDICGVVVNVEVVEIGYLVKNIFAAIVLGVCFFQDLKYRKIHFVAPILCTAFFVTTDILFSDINYGNMLLHMIPGFIVLAIAIIKKEMIGAGDGVIIIMMGMAVGIEKVLYIVMIAFGSAIVYFTIYNIINRIRGMSDRKTEIPFVPCISVGYIVVIAGNIFNL